MDNEALRANKVEEKVEPGEVRFNWNTENEAFLIESWYSFKNSPGWKSNSSAGEEIAYILKCFKENSAIGPTPTRDQVFNKINVIMELHGEFMQLLHQSGFNLDPKTFKITADDGVLEEYCKRNLKNKTFFLENGWPHWEKLEAIIGESNGKHCFASVNASEFPSVPDLAPLDSAPLVTQKNNRISNTSIIMLYNYDTTYPPQHQASGLPPYSYPAPQKGSHKGNQFYPPHQPVYSAQAYQAQNYNEDLPPPYTPVAQATVEQRRAFVRKVYMILVAQLVLTTGMSLMFYTSESIKKFVQGPSASGITIASGILSIVFAIAAFCFRKRKPINLILLFLFTLCESYLVAAVVTYYDVVVVLEAFGVTLGIFIGLSLYTVYSKKDFSGMGPVLFVALIGLVLASLVQMIVSLALQTEFKALDLLISFAGAVIFSLYIVFDTYMIMNRLNIDEYVLGALSLYVDIINLFLNLLRIFEAFR